MYWGLAMPIVIGFGVILGFGTYIFYQLICYLKEKPQALQTLIDRIYGQHFQIIIIRSWCVGISQSAFVLSLNIPGYITTPFCWFDHFMRNLVPLHLFICLLVKYMLIYKPEAIEEFLDDDLSMWSW